MPKSTMAEEAEFKLPKEVALPAVLNAVEEKEIPYTDKKTGKPAVFRKWQWEFEVTDGPYMGLRAWADTENRLTNHPDNKVRLFAEALFSAEFEIGQDLDTDDLLGLPCEIVVDNVVHEKKNGDLSYLCPVVQVWPAGTSAPDEAPF